MSAMMTRERLAIEDAPLYADFAASVSPLTREQIVDRIISMNQTATAEFLASFSDRALRLYMEHLQAAAMPRGRNARWVRPSDHRAASVHESVD